MQSYACLEKFVNDFNLLSKERGGFGQIQKVFSSPYYIYLSIRFAGISKFIVVSRAFPFSYIGIHDQNIEADIRVKDGLLDWYRKVFRNKRLLKLSLNKEKEYLFGSFHDGSEIYFCFFHKEPLWIHFYKEKETFKYIDSNRLKAFKMTSDNFDLNEILNDDGKIAFKVQDYSSNSERSTIIAVQSKDNAKSQKKQDRFNRQKRINILGDMEKLEKVVSLKSKLISHAVDVDQALNELSLQKKFKSEKTIEQKRDKFFKLIKRYERGLEILKERLERLETYDDQKEQKESELVTAIFPRNIFTDKKEIKRKVDYENDGEIQKYQVNNLKFAVGKNSQGNDYLRNRYGVKTDYWFHLEGEKGAHVVVKSHDINKILTEYVDIFASILRDSSQLNILEIPLIYCQLSDLKSIKGRAGAVIPKRPRYFVANYVPEWKEIITEV